MCWLHHIIMLYYHYVNMQKRQTSFNPEWTKEHKFISKSSRDAFHGFCTLCRCKVYLCIYIFSRSPEMLCFLALCQIICLFMYVFYFHKSRYVLFSWAVPDYLFIYVFLLFPEVQKGYVFRHCEDRFISVISFWNRHHNVLNKYKYCEQTLFCLFCYT